MRTAHIRLRRPGIAAATAALAVAGIVGGVSVASAGETKTIYSVFNNNNNPCFSLESKLTCAPDERPTVTIRTGDTIVWDMSSGGVHNAAPVKSAPTDDAVWNARPEFEFPPTDTYTFGKAGTYAFVCTAHGNSMTGTIIVEGDPVETPTPSVTATATSTSTSTPTATPTFQATIPPGVTPVPDDHLNTPAPGAGAKDTTAPRLLRAKVKRVARGAKLSFWVSEPATIQVQAFRKGVKKPVTSATLHVAAGARSVTVRSSSLRKKGTYTFQWQAIDAMANKSNVAKKTLRVKR